MNHKQYTYTSNNKKGSTNVIYSQIASPLKCKISEIMTFTGKLMHMEVIIMSEISQTQKDKLHMLLSNVNSVFYRRSM